MKAKVVLEHDENKLEVDLTTLWDICLKFAVGYLPEWVQKFVKAPPIFKK